MFSKFLLGCCPLVDQYWSCQSETYAVELIILLVVVVDVDVVVIVVVLVCVVVVVVGPET